MAWEHLSIDKPHLVYIILGGFTSLFMLCSLVIKEKLYIGEATVATICGVIFGPHAANLINPFSWGNTDQITLEFSRIVLVVQCFAVGVELPKAYMERHWKSVVFLLLPVMTFGWLMTSVFIWWMIVPLTWLEALACAACVTATDPVLASSVVGKGKFAKRVPKHLRDVLSAESGCNDGMAFPFIYLSIYLLRYRPNAGQVIFHWTCYTILYECIFGAFYGFMIGYIARHLIKYSERKGLIDRESFLVFYFTLALFCAGSGSMLGMDDLLIGFSAGVGFSNDGWFTEKTEESHVSNVIDLLLNLAYFVYLGTIIPWDQYNTPSVGLTPWRLSVIAIFVILFRRIPIMMALKPIIPDIKTWREALFAGHFGPIGVGAIFAAILARSELETESTYPLSTIPPPGTKDYELIYLIWPVTTFLVISSILVHGSSIAVFTLGRRINTLTLTFSYTQDNESGPGWMNRLPRISSQSRSMSKTSLDSLEKPEFPPGVLPPTGIPGNFLRRQREEDTEKAGSRPSSVRSYRRKKKRDGAGGPISQSAIAPQRRSEPNLLTQESGSDTLYEKSGEPSPDSLEASLIGERTAPSSSRTSSERGQAGRQRRMRRSTDPNRPADVESYEEGHELIIEDTEGNVLRTVETGGKSPEEKAAIIEAERYKLTHETSGEHAKHKGEPHGKNEGEEIEHNLEEAADHPERTLRKQLDKWRGWGKRKDDKEEKAELQSNPQSKLDKPERRRGPAHAYQFGNTIIVEDEEGEVLKKYTIPSESRQRSTTASATDMRRGLKRMGTWVGVSGTSEQHAASDNAAATALAQGGEALTDRDGTRNEGGAKELPETESDDGLRMTISHADRYGLTGRLRDDGTINTSGRRMSTKDFIKQMQQLDTKAKIQTVNESDAPEGLKREINRQAKEEKDGQSPVDSRKRAGTMPSSRPQIRATETAPTLQRRPEAARRAETEFPPAKDPHNRRPVPVRTTTEETLASNDASDEEVPTYDITATLARHGKGSTAAESRRQRLANIPPNNDMDNETEQAETAAEKRRRLAALGVGGEQEESSSDEDVDAPRRPREEKEPVPEPSRQTRPRVQWGGESGRERGREREKDSHHHAGGLKGIFGQRSGA
jgi:NhaP-type Na+/H+ or K+/H+ antiporter